MNKELGLSKLLYVSDERMDTIFIFETFLIHFNLNAMTLDNVHEN